MLWMKLYFSCLVLALVLGIANGQFLPQEAIEQHIIKAQNIAPGTNYRDCTTRVMDSTYEVRCQHKNITKSCSGPPEPKAAWFLQCLAKMMIVNGFQIPVYVTRGNSIERYNRLNSQLIAAKFKHVFYFSDDDTAGMVDPESHFVQVRGHKEGGPRSKEETTLCIDALETSFHKGREWSEYMCYYHGTGKLNDKDKKLFLINHLMLETISNRTTHESSTVYASNATLPHLQYVLFLEDDAFVSVTALRQIAEVFLQGPPDNSPNPVDLYWLCDSHCNRPPYRRPPAHLNEATFVNPYYLNTSNTVMATLVSLPTVHHMYRGGGWIPSYRAIDHWFNYYIWKQNLTVQHTHPPIICHGSHGIEEMLGTPNGPSRRKNSQFCCEDYYNLHNMHPYLTSMKLVPKS